MQGILRILTTVWEYSVTQELAMSWINGALCEDISSERDKRRKHTVLLLDHPDFTEHGGEYQLVLEKIPNGNGKLRLAYLEHYDTFNKAHVIKRYA